MKKNSIWHVLFFFLLLPPKSGTNVAIKTDENINTKVAIKIGGFLEIRRELTQEKHKSIAGENHTDTNEVMHPSLPTKPPNSNKTGNKNSHLLSKKSHRNQNQF